MHYITKRYTYLTEGLTLTVLSCTLYFELCRAGSATAIDESIMKVAHRRVIFEKNLTKMSRSRNI